MNIKAGLGSLGDEICTDELLPLWDRKADIAYGPDLMGRLRAGLNSSCEGGGMGREGKIYSQLRSKIGSTGERCTVAEEGGLGDV